MFICRHECLVHRLVQVNMNIYGFTVACLLFELSMLSPELSPELSRAMKERRGKSILMHLLYVDRFNFFVDI